MLGQTQFIGNLALLNGQRLNEDWNKLQQNRPPATFKASLANQSKNRFINIGADDGTRVILQSGEYINANMVQSGYGSQRFILSQGPLANTVDGFWKMLIQNNVKMIIQLCLPFEKKLNQNTGMIEFKQKTAVYFPKNINEIKEAGLYHIKLMGCRGFVKNDEKVIRSEFWIYERLVYFWET
uniref:Tyrosine-protein phosphatase domain-containing protein n=1 Tax=Panagrolaimus davidi TaxID=227884 RepID=A0A914QDS2_9BILA